MMNSQTTSLSKLLVVPILNLLVSVVLLAYHAHAEVGENESAADVFTRLLSGPDFWTTMDKIVFIITMIMGMEVLNTLAKHSGAWLKTPLVPVRGKHLDELRSTDKLFIGISKAMTGPFVYILLRYCLSEENVLWKLEDISLQTVLLPLPALFIVFDFFYTIMHWALHIKAVYGFIHKHHHHQKAPSRANIDAINVHPIEFFLGEYNHLWSMFLCCRVLNLKIHIMCTLLFLVIGGVLAGWNHTRFDIVFSIFGYRIFDSKAHDVHHRIPQSNYGQYTMFWDHVFGTFREYNPKDRVNPNAQLDPKTGKSLEYIKNQNLHQD